ncbi:S-DNA-T family DNA segregation ATPase FtsK/SpoIIIE [Pseudonocardia sediminis]|uniref:S-DNA-T family DNA segregation ATPase FtsK/SpoIIIE n=1 Tax=Pseudonocardia sediminis TaxID=1397368 RepID=A0A4Q7V1X5_PSEST|nr:type VII secretion protein EccCa [Pseudonocardia sediminis]RZT88346.1 S-DNA-T family DNA segregation ATPase FtsK/SpoIIIE [Pseudonocardia sediminis]
MSSTVGVRRPRRTVPRAPGGELVMEPPPEPERVVPSGLIGRLLPLVMVFGSVGFVLMRPEEPTSWMFGGMFAISALGMLASGGGGRGAGARTATMDEDRRDYLRYLDVLAQRVGEISREQREALETVHPDPAAWPAVLAAGRLWERRASDTDFGQLRVGVGPQRLATRLTAPQTGPVESLEPISALALRQFLRRHSLVADLPVAVDTRASSTVWLEPASDSDGDLGPARALARSMVAQYVLWHSPADAQLAVVASGEATVHWEWAKWLPHAAHPRLTDAVGPLRMLTGDPDEVRRWWVGEAVAGQRHLLVVADGEGTGPGPWAGVPGVTVLRVGAAQGRRAAPSVVRLAVGADVLSRAGGAGARLGRPDAFTVAEARALARRLARYRPTEALDGADDDAPTGPSGLPDLIGLDGLSADRVAALRARRRHSDADRLRVPLGTDASGRPVLLDLKESAQGGAGPHGLCIGATGSGKSELLRTLVLGLVATHSADELNLVLVDFKGGATFLGFADLPHVSAVITNLADELTLVDRMGDAIAGEITRRQELLRAAGNFVGAADYEAARRGGADLAPLPALLIVVDEFSELLAQRPEMIDLMVTIGRLGRSLGLHLLLASQRLDEGRLRGLESHLSYRIALRTFSAAESRAVLGVPDAHQLPPTPGAAFLSAGTDELLRLRAAYVSGPPPAATPVAAAGRVVRRRARPFSARPVPDLPAPRTAPGPVTPEVPAPATPSVLELVVAAVSGPGPRAHRVWLPPLDVPPVLTEVLGAVTPVPGRGLGASGPVGRLSAPIGLVDRPYLQRRDPLVLDLSGAAGHLAVVGGPRAGKSTALRTVVLALALTHTPHELGMHVLDFGGGALGPLAALPHVGTVADRQQPDLVRRTLAEFAAVLDRRERVFRDAGVGSVEEFRARRVAGEFADEPATDLLLVVDGYLTLRTEFADTEDRLTALAGHGLSYGVHLAVAAGRWTEIRSGVKDLLGSRIELRLGEPSDSEIDRRRAAAVPSRPGHGLAPDAEPAVIAAPALDDGDPAAALRTVAAAWDGPGVPAVRLLPERITVEELPPGPGHGIPIGVDEDRLATVELDPDEPHLLCFADAESGKTTLLRTLARGICERFTPDQARIVVVDHRRGLLGAVPDSHLIGYASTAAATAEAATEIAGSLGRRMPGPDVTPRRLRERSWWSGPDVWLLVDDYDLVAPTGSGSPHPLLALTEYLPQAKDVGLHVVLTRRSGGAGRSLFDPVLGRLRELGAPGLVGSGSPDEGALVESVKPSPLPPGRSVLVDRRRGARRVQLAWLEPDLS